MMRAVLAAGVAGFVLLSAAASAQSMPGMEMSGHAVHQHARRLAAKPPAARKPARPAAKPKATSAPVQGPAVQSNDHKAMDGMAMPGMSPNDDTMAEPVNDGAQEGTALTAGDRPAPAPPQDHYADRTYGADVMAVSRAALPADHGGATFSQVLLNIAEYQVRQGKDAYRWDGEAWFGDDMNRLAIKSEGEGGFRKGAEHVEVQALYSRAIDPYWNLRGGLRYDFRPKPSRAYATVGIEGLAPYWFEVEAALFLSDKGDLLGRLEAWHDMRLNQRVVLQPRVELNFAAQDMPVQQIGSDLSNAELGLRLRYEMRREFAPYVGLSWERKLGDTARYVRRAGEGNEATSIVAGIRTWF